MKTPPVEMDHHGRSGSAASLAVGRPDQRSAIERGARARGISLRPSTPEVLRQTLEPGDVVVFDSPMLTATLSDRIAPGLRLLQHQGSEIYVVQWGTNGSTGRVFRFEDAADPSLMDRVERLLHIADARLDRVLLGRSWAMDAVRTQIRRLALFRQVSVMILGESGTGKELVARGLHAMNSHDGPFVAVNCAAVPASLFESTLFGHDEGAFTGAEAQRRGLLEEAGRGTLFLDEIGEMPLAQQAKLLRALEERSFRRVGSRRGDIPFDARVVSATNANPKDAENFRSDLFHRLAAFTIAMPPLRHRPEDILDLAPAFLAEFCRRHRLHHELTPGAITRLQEHAWPGNVRELRAVVERTAITSGAHRIEAAHVDTALPPRPSTVRSIQTPVRGRQKLRRAEKEMTLTALERNDGNVSRTATQLGLPRSTLRARLRKYRAEDEPSEERVADHGQKG